MTRLATFQEFFSLGGSHELRVVTIPHFSSLLVLVAFLLRYCLKRLISGLSKPKSTGKQPVLNSVPSIVPILGHHLSLLSAPAEKLQQWAKQYGSVFMIRLGNRRVAMVNSGAAAREIYARHSNALNSRPEVWTYHHVRDISADTKQEVCVNVLSDVLQSNQIDHEFYAIQPIVFQC